MLIYCPICGHEHEEGNMPTDEEAIKGAVMLGLMREITPQYADAYNKYREALKKMLVEG